MHPIYIRRSISASADESPRVRLRAVGVEVKRVFPSADVQLINEQRSERPSRKWPDDQIQRICRVVDFEIRQHYPGVYAAQCHAYATVGACVFGTVLGGNYRPVAGLAVIDCGQGCFMKFTDNKAFSRPAGGAHHCWIESCPQDGEEKSLIDISFKHNSAYAKMHQIPWRKIPSDYLWGSFSDLVIDGELDDLPAKFPDGKVWFHETPEGREWMHRHVTSQSRRLRKNHCIYFEKSENILRAAPQDTLLQRLAYRFQHLRHCALNDPVSLHSNA